MSARSYDGRSKKDKEEQDAVVHKLRSSPTLYKLANKLLFNFIQLAKAANMSKADILFNISQQTLNAVRGKRTKKRRSVFNSTLRIKGDAIVKNGYNCKRYNCNEILECKSEEELLSFNLKNNIKLMQITSAFYPFQRNGVIFTYCIKNQPTLKKYILTRFKNLFHVPDTFTFNDLEAIIKRADKASWFMPWFFLYGLSKAHSTTHAVLGVDSDFVRRRISEFSSANTIELRTRDTHNTNEYNSDIQKVIKGTTYSQPVINGFWWNLMKKYNKQIIAGPSGSSMMLFISVFILTRMLPATFKNKRDILGLLLTDFYPTHHSISEILQVYAEDAKLPKYNLAMNDIEYLCKIGLK